MKTFPGISVVVPVFNAGAKLQRCLEALENQDYPGFYEVLVIDNNCTDTSMSYTLGKDCVKVLRCKKQSPSAARNIGIRNSLYSLIAFTDADCIPEPNWLRELFLAMQEGVTGVGGKINSASKGLIQDYVEKVSFNQKLIMTSKLPYIATCNAMIRREALQEIGLFDEDFNLAGGEDNDLGWRLYIAGHTFKYAPKAVIKHCHPSNFWDFSFQRFRYGYGEGLLLKKYKDRAEIHIPFTLTYLLKEWVRICGDSFKIIVDGIRESKPAWGGLGIISLISFFLGNTVSYFSRRNPSHTKDFFPKDLSDSKKRLICNKPWTSFEVDDQFGNVFPCCWTTKKVGNINKDSITEIWNGPEFQEFRQKMLEGDIGDICPADCPYRIGSRHDQIEEIEHATIFNSNVRQIKKALANEMTKVPAYPLYMRILPSIHCNLDCIMCWQRVQEDGSYPDSFFQEAIKLFPYLKVFTIQGGEPLLIKNCVKLLKEGQAKLFPNLGFSIMTNGTLLNQNFLTTIEHTRINNLFVSLDAQSSETYKTIRGGKFLKVVNGLKLVKKQRPDIPLILGFVVMNENVSEIRGFIQFAERQNAHFEFSPLNPAYKKGDDFGDQEFRKKLKTEILKAEIYMSDHGIRDDSMLTVKHRMWNQQFVHFL